MNCILIQAFLNSSWFHDAIMISKYHRECWTSFCLIIIWLVPCGRRTRSWNEHKSDGYVLGVCKNYGMFTKHIHDFLARFINSLDLDEAIWCHATWSTLLQVMAWCPMAPSHYLNLCWLIIKEVLWHSPEAVLHIFQTTYRTSCPDKKIINGTWVLIKCPKTAEVIGYMSWRGLYY